MRRIVLLLVLVLAACWSGGAATAGTQPVLPANAIRPPDVKTDMDENPANLGSAVITHAFGQLPVYIDGAKERLLPFDVFRTSQPGTKSVSRYRITMPRTSLVLDTAMASSLTEAQAREDASQYRIAVSIDGAAVANPSRLLGLLPEQRAVDLPHLLPRRPRDAEHGREHARSSVRSRRGRTRSRWSSTGD